MFNRPHNTYNYCPDIIKAILDDPASPLNRISEIIPDNAKVLDIGAGNGLLASVLKEKRNGLTIDGIEPNPYGADLARANYRNFYIGMAQEFKDVIFKENYDYIVLADVIEHIYDPKAFLIDLCAGLNKKTKVILSIPNVAFGAVRISLLNGAFNYVASGLLEKTHIRFFTLSTIETLVGSVDMFIDKLCFLQRNMFNSEIRLQKFKCNFFCLSQIVNDDLSWTYQFLLVISKSQVVPEKLFYGRIPKLPLFSYFYYKYIRERLLIIKRSLTYE